MMILIYIIIFFVVLSFICIFSIYFKITKTNKINIEEHIILNKNIKNLNLDISKILNILNRYNTNITNLTKGINNIKNLPVSDLSIEKLKNDAISLEKVNSELIKEILLLKNKIKNYGEE